MHSTDHEAFMRVCGDLARESSNSGDLPFGSVIVRSGEIVAKGHNTGLTNVTGHAEINAINDFLLRHSRQELRDCSLYTNLEPCAMCAFLIRDCGIKRVIFSVASPHAGGYTRWNILSSEIPEPFTSYGIRAGPEVIGGVLAEENFRLFDSLNWKMHHSS